MFQLQLFFGSIVTRCSSAKTQVCHRSYIIAARWSSTNFTFLFWYEIQNGGYGRTYFNIEPYGEKVSKHFFSETFWTIETKLPRNVHWMVLYKLYVFCSDMKFKMAATAGLSLTFDPLGKMFKNASSLKPLGQLKPNCPGMIIGRSSTKSLFSVPIGNPRWPPPQDID